MRIFWYLTADVVRTTIAVTVLLMLIFMSSRFVGYLADAAAGEIASDVLFKIMFYRLPGFLESILPLSFFIAILLAYGRFYVESEMIVLQACGLSQTKLMVYTLIPAVLLALLLGWLSLVITPGGESRVLSILNDPKARTGLNTLATG